MSKRAAPKSGEQEKISQLKRYIYSRNPITVETRKKYSRQPEVKKRRQDLNKERRYLNSILIRLLKEGELFTNTGSQYSFINNRCVIKEEKKLVCLDAHKVIAKVIFTDDISLLDLNYVAPCALKHDKKFSELLQKFVDGDEEIMSLVSKKRVVTEAEDENIDQIRLIIKQQLDESSSSGEE